MLRLKAEHFKHTSSAQAVLLAFGKSRAIQYKLNEDTAQELCTMGVMNILNIACEVCRQAMNNKCVECVCLCFLSVCVCAFFVVVVVRCFRWLCVCVL